MLGMSWFEKLIQTKAFAHVPLKLMEEVEPEVKF
jgi:hypothetical protein